MKVLERLRHLSSMAWSSVDQVDDVSISTDSRVFAQQYVRYWGRLLGTLEHKPFAQLLGKGLEIYAQDLKTLKPN
jgi:heme oxygenase